MIWRSVVAANSTKTRPFIHLYSVMDTGERKTNKQRGQRIQHRCDKWLSKEDAIRQMAAKSLGKVTKVKNRRSLPTITSGIQLTITSTPLNTIATKQTSIQSFFSKPHGFDNSKKSKDGGTENRTTLHESSVEHFTSNIRNTSMRNVLANNRLSYEQKKTGETSRTSKLGSFNSQTLDPLFDDGSNEFDLIHDDEKTFVNQHMKQSETSLQFEGCNSQAGPGIKRHKKGVGKHSVLHKQSLQNTKMIMECSENTHADPLDPISQRYHNSKVVNSESQLSDSYDLSQKSPQNLHQKNCRKSDLPCDQVSSQSEGHHYDPSLGSFNPLSDISLSQESGCSDIFMERNSQTISQKMQQFDQEMQLIYSKFKKPKLDVVDLISSESESCD